jgi:hypothetical protein
MKQLQPLVLALALSTLFILPPKICHGQENDTLNNQIKSFVHQIETRMDSLDLNLYFLIKELDNLALDAYKYKIRPTSMAGGGGSYTHYQSPPSSRYTEHGKYSLYGEHLLINVNPNFVEFVGESRKGYGSIHAKVDSVGILRFLSVSGKLNDKLK